MKVPGNRIGAQSGDESAKRQPANPTAAPPSPYKVGRFRGSWREELFFNKSNALNRFHLVRTKGTKLANPLVRNHRLPLRRYPPTRRETAMKLRPLGDR